MADVVIRLLHPHEWQSLRELRLRALAEAPDAFGQTYDATVAQPTSYWQEWAAGTRFGRRQASQLVTYIAETGADWWGLATGYFPLDAPDTVALVAMWVDPTRRGTGLAALLTRVITWARQHNARQVELAVTETRHAARRLYERAGFRPTGQVKPLASNPSLREEHLVLRLEWNASGQPPSST